MYVVCILALLSLSHVVVASREESPCILDFHVDNSEQLHEPNKTARIPPAVHELHADRKCVSDSEFWFYSEDYTDDSVINKHMRQQWWSRTFIANAPSGDAPYYSDEEDHVDVSNANAQSLRKDPTVGVVQCNGLACVPPFWGWWSVVRAQCTLEWIGQRAQRAADRAPWDSGAVWNHATQKLSMSVEDTYIMAPRGDSPTAAYVWHCQMHPRVYSALSLQCNGDPVDEDNSTTNTTRTNYRVNNIHQQCVLNVHVGRGAHLLIYVISAALFVGVCGLYLCCMWACFVCCNCRAWPCIRWLPCFRGSHDAAHRRHHRAMRDMGPDGSANGPTAQVVNTSSDSAWELPSAKRIGFASTFARMARAGGISGGGGLRGAQMV